MEEFLLCNFIKITHLHRWSPVNLRLFCRAPMDGCLRTFTLYQETHSFLFLVPLHSYNSSIPLLYRDCHPYSLHSYPQFPAFPPWFPAFPHWFCTFSSSAFPPWFPSAPSWLPTFPSFPTWLPAFPSFPSFCSLIPHSGFYTYPASNSNCCEIHILRYNSKFLGCFTFRNSYSKSHKCSNKRNSAVFL